MTTIPRNRTKVIAALKAQYPYPVAHRKDDDYTACVVPPQSPGAVRTGHRSAALTQQPDRLKIPYPLGWFALFPDAAAPAATLPPKPEPNQAPVVNVLHA